MSGSTSKGKPATAGPAAANAAAATTPSAVTSVASSQPLSGRRSEPLDLSTVERRNHPLPGSREPKSRTHIAGIKEAPTFRPTEEEWKDPFEYMQKIAPEGSKYGICKIIPPDSWEPDFAIDTERFHFKTRKQELNFVEGGSRANLDYLDKLAKYHKSQGMNLNRFPSVDKRPLDLYELKKAVEAKGGFDEVCKGKKWAEIGRLLGYSGKIMSSLSTSLKNSYAKWLEPYERYLRATKKGVQAQLEKERGGPYTPSPSSTPVKASNQATPSELGKASPAIRASQALHDQLDTKPPLSAAAPPQVQDPPPSRPSSGFTAVNRGFTAVNKASPAPSPAPNTAPEHFAGKASTSLHKSVEMLSRSSSTNGHSSHDLKRRLSDASDSTDSNSAAQDNRRSKRVKRDSAPMVTGSQMAQPKFAHTKAKHIKPRHLKPGDYCEVCFGSKDDKNILLCEACYNGYHTYCLDPPLTSVPEFDWHCPKCLVGTGEFGFEEGGTYSLRTFQEKAKNFKKRHFLGKLPFDPVSNGPRALTEDDIEREFWRLVSHKHETVEVEYGADIHSTTHGSGFPTIERNPRNKYSNDPWNLNVLPLDQSSLFRHIKSDISGMTVPWLYVGMVFSTFCWHNEDHYTYSANYQHFGATKTWYGIPGSDSDLFENAMRNAVPELFESQPDLLFQLVTLLAPEQLQKEDVQVYAVDQRAGQFVITFPKAYHAGFNHGFNFNEAVNFAPPDWEPFGEEGVRRLREFRRQPCFSHDELLLTASAAKDCSIKSAKWLGPALERMLDAEKAARQEFETHVRDGRLYMPQGSSSLALEFDKIVDSDDLPEDEYVCAKCGCYSYLSRWICHNSKKASCLEHAGDGECCQSANGHSFCERIPMHKLEQAVQKIVDKANIPEAWAAKFDLAINESPKPQLKVLRSLLAEGERIPWDLPDLPDLKRFVDRCNEWVEEAASYITRKHVNRRKNEKVWRRGSKTNPSEIEEKEKELRSIDNIKKLLADADLIGFDYQDITTLQERANEVDEFRLKARKAMLECADLTSSAIEELISLGRDFTVDIPEVESLEKVLAQMQWQEKARDRSQHKTLQDVDELIAQASSLHVPERHEDLLFLRDQRLRGEQWEAKAKELMAVDDIHFAQLDAFSKQAEGLPVSRDTLAAIDAILRKQREAEQQIQSLLDRSRNTDFRQRPKYKEVREVMESVEALTSKPQGTMDLEKEQKRHEDWMRRGKKLFGKTNAPLHILHQHLQIVDKRNEHCFDLTDRPRAPAEPASREHSPDASASAGQSTSSRDVFCLCRTPEAGMMIECMLCHEWYHSRCLKIARGKVKEDDDYVCPICDWRGKIPRDADRPRLEELMDLQAQVSSLPFQPDEEGTIDNIINVAQTFREAIAQYVQPDSVMCTAEEVPIIRFYLRKIEGADILLAEETNFFKRELHRFCPVADEPPPIREVSKSTRKPRPTKQQKLMAQFGITNPEDLPPQYRTKPYHATKRKQQEDGKSNGQSDVETTPAKTSATTPVTRLPTGSGNRGDSLQALSFKPPLTADHLAHKHGHRGGSGPESPMFSPGAASQGTGTLSVNGSGNVRPADALFAAPGSSDSGAREFDNGLFGNAEASLSLATSYRNGQRDDSASFDDHDSPQEEEDAGDDMFGPPLGSLHADAPSSSQPSAGKYDNMFVSYADHEEANDGGRSPGHDDLVDPSLQGSRFEI